MDYYWLRTFLIQHLLQPVFANSLSSPEERVETIQMCSFFLNKERHQTYIASLSENSKPPAKFGGSDVPLSYPLLQHLNVWLLCDDLERAMQLLRDMEACPYVDDDGKDESWGFIWSYLLGEGKIFLDGHTQSPLYYEKRELLYNSICGGMYAIGREATKVFFQDLAKKIWNHPDATGAERQYVLKACQQTLLRIFFKCRGLGAYTIQYFLDETEWPVPIGAGGGASSAAVVPEGSASVVGSRAYSKELEYWAENFLKDVVPIPPSLLDECFMLNMDRLLEKPYENPPEPQFLLISPDASEGDAEVQPAAEEERFSTPHKEQEVQGQQPEEGEEHNEAHEDDRFHPAYEGEEHHQPEEYNEDGNRQRQEEGVVLDDSGEQAAQQQYEEPEEGEEIGDDYDEEDLDGSDQEEIEILDSDEEENQQEEFDSDREEEAVDVDAEGAGGGESSDEPVEIYDSDDIPVAEGQGEEQSEDESDDSVDDEPRFRFAAQQQEAIEGQQVDIAENSSDEDAGEYEEDAVVIDGPEEVEDADDMPPADVPSEPDNEGEEGYEQPQVGLSAQQPEVIHDEELEVGDDIVVVRDGISEDNDEDRVVPDERPVDTSFCPDADDSNDFETPQAPAATSGNDEYVDRGNNPTEPEDGEDLQQSSAVDVHGDDGPSAENSQNSDKQAEAVASRAFVQEYNAASQSRDDAEEKAESASPKKESMDLSQENTKESASRKSTTGTFQDATSEPPSSKAHETSSVGQDAASGQFSAKTHESAASVDQDVPDRRASTDDQNEPVDMIDSGSPSKTKESASAGEQPNMDQDDRRYMEGKGSTRNDAIVDSDATDDEQERALEVEKAETEVAAVGGEFGDTTEEEDGGKANRAAMANRTADLRANKGYASQLEEGYEPEDTHGYTEEEVSEAMHTEDEEEERQRAQESRITEVVEPPEPKVAPIPRKAHSNPHSSDDMDAADEHTEQEEDLGAESSELEESTEVPRYSASYSPAEHQEAPTTLWQYAQTAQNQHETSLQQAADEEQVEQDDNPRGSEPCGDKSVGFVEPTSDVVDYSGEPYGTVDSKSQDSEPTESDMLHDPHHGGYTESETNDESKALAIARQKQNTESETNDESKALARQKQNTKDEREMESQDTRLDSPMHSMVAILENNQAAMDVDNKNQAEQDEKVENDGEPAAESTEAVQGSVMDSVEGGSVEGDQKAAPTASDERPEEPAAAEEVWNTPASKADSALANNDEKPEEPAADTEVANTPAFKADSADVFEDKTTIEDVVELPNEVAASGDSKNTAAKDMSDEDTDTADIKRDEELGQKIVEGSEAGSPRPTPKTRDDDDGNGHANEPDVPEETSESRRRLFDEDSEAQADKEDNSVVSETSDAGGTKRKRGGRGKKAPVADDGDSVASSTRRTTRRSTRQTKAAEDDASVTSTKEAEGHDSVASSTRRRTRGATKVKAKDDESVTLSIQERNEQEEEKEESVASSTRRRTRGSAEAKAKDDVSIASANDAEEHESVASSTRRTTRASTKSKDKDDDDASVHSRVSRTSPRKTRGSTRSKANDDDGESVQSRSSRTSPRKTRSKANDDDGDSVVSQGSRRSSRLKKKKTEDRDSGDESVASQASVASRPRRGRKRPAVDTIEEEPSNDESVESASVACRTRRGGKKTPTDTPTRNSARTRKAAKPKGYETESADEEESTTTAVSKTKGRGRAKKVADNTGKPPLPPQGTRKSTRTRKKKAEDV